MSVYKRGMSGGIRSQIIWAKQHFALSRGDYHWQHEPCWYAVRDGKTSNWNRDRAQSTLWQVASLNLRRTHASLGHDAGIDPNPAKPEPNR
jgi:hypothetical protein